MKKKIMALGCTIATFASFGGILLFIFTEPKIVLYCALILFFVVVLLCAMYMYYKMFLEIFSD